MLPAKMLRYILQSSALHQIVLLALTVSVFLIEVVPLELQRRIVNDAVKHREFQLIITLCAVYAGVALGHGILKMILNVYRGWVAQHVTRDLRKRVRALEVERRSEPRGGGAGHRDLHDHRRGGADRPLRRRGAVGAAAPGRHPGDGSCLYGPHRSLDDPDRGGDLHSAIRLRAADAGRDQPAHQLGHHHPQGSQRQPDGPQTSQCAPTTAGRRTIRGSIGFSA